MNVIRLICLSIILILTGCSSMNGMLGGNTREQALAEINWEYAKDAIQIQIHAAEKLNEYAGEAHTMLLGVYQMNDASAFYKLIADPVALAKMMENGKSGDGFLEFSRYVIEPGQRAMLLLDRAQKTRFVGITAGYYQMRVDNSARLLEVPVQITSTGLMTKKYQARATPLAAQIQFGTNAIVNLVLNKALLQPISDGEGKEIKLTADDVRNKAALYETLQKIED